MDAAIPYNLMAKTGLDIAAYDLAAQAAGVPIHDLIGGRRVDAVPQISPIGLDSPKEAARAAKEKIGLGFNTIKVKIGLKAAQDIARVEAVRKAVGEEIALRVDGNAGYDRATALHTFRRMEPVGLEWIEQPLPGWDLEGMAMLARRLDTPIAVDESMYTDHDARLCIKLGAADAVNIKVAKCGGLYRSQKIAAVCQAAGVPCFLGGCIETSVGTAAALHFYAATPNVVSSAEIHGSPFYVDDVAEEPFSAVNGALAVPSGPGLGIKVDEKKVRKYQLTY
jgi:muconate cycloisomerase